MPVGIPSSHYIHRYSTPTGELRGRRVDLAKALRAFADDLLDNGDPRLALDRAFRWGYRDEDGEHISGLQEHLQALRHQRDRLVRTVEHDSFLEVLSPVLDRIDEQDGTLVGDEAGRSSADRLADRLGRGYESAEARSEFDSLVQALQEVAAGLDGRGEARRGRGQPGSALGSMRPTRSAAADRLRKTLFQGGGQPGEPSPATGSWRTGARVRDVVQRASFDILTLGELERVERELEALERIGSVTELGEIDLSAVVQTGGEIGEWLGEWSAVVDRARSGTGQITLPPDVVRAIGRDLLKGLFRAASSPATGEHHSTSTGNAGDPAEATIGWEPGKPLDLNLVATLSNAIRRPGAFRRERIRLLPEDFAIVERTSTVAVSTVLAIDRSRSMGQSGAWTAAKKISMAMHELIRQSYPRDSLDVIAFSSSAERAPFEAIPEMHWDEFEHGTHLQAALELGRRIHRRSGAGTRQIVVITDGEPTIATIGNEEVFASPPSEEVLHATMAEVMRCTRENIVINVVMLGSETASSTFAEQVARVNRGRIFVATNESLGTYLLRDYVAR